MNNRKPAHPLKALMCAALLLVMIVTVFGALAETEPSASVSEAEYLALKERLEALYDTWTELAAQAEEGV